MVHCFLVSYFVLSDNILSLITSDVRKPTYTNNFSQPIFMKTCSIIRPRRSRSAAAYSDQAFQWTICRSVCPVQCRKSTDRIRMPFGIIGRMGPGMRQIVGFGDRSTEMGTFGAIFGRAIVANGDFTAYVCDSLVV